MDSKTNILNSFFTRSMLRQLIEGRSNKVYFSIVNRHVDEPYNKKNVELVKDIYSELRKNYRNEYYYKNTLLNKLLLGVHSVNTTTALTEVSIADSKADFVLINGKAVVYEIKTELDNLDRINTQINDYYKAFDHVVVVTCEKNRESIEKTIKNISKPVGIYILTKNGCLKTLKKPKRYTKDLDKTAIFAMLRKKEYEQLLLNYYGYLPSVNHFEYYSECKKLFLRIPLNNIYPFILKTLKNRKRIEKEEFDNVPYELKFLTYFMNFKSSEYDKLNVFLEKKYGGI